MAGRGRSAHEPGTREPGPDLRDVVVDLPLTWPGGLTMQEAAEAAVDAAIGISLEEADREEAEEGQLQRLQERFQRSHADAVLQAPVGRVFVYELRDDTVVLRADRDPYFETDSAYRLQDDAAEQLLELLAVADGDFDDD